MTFESALTELKAGCYVWRTGWNGRAMWLVLVKNGEATVAPVRGLALPPLGPFIVMKTTQDTLVPWVASQTDLLADDWQAGPRP